MIEHCVFMIFVHAKSSCENICTPKHLKPPNMYIVPLYYHLATLLCLNSDFFSSLENSISNSSKSSAYTRIDFHTSS